MSRVKIAVRYFHAILYSYNAQDIIYRGICTRMTRLTYLELENVRTAFQYATITSSVHCLAVIAQTRRR